MSAVAAAIGGSAALGLGGAIMQSGAAKDAAQMQADASRYAADQQRQMYEEQRSDQQPWRQAGVGALSQMQDPYFQQNFSMSDFQQDPGYQFRMDQGMKALQASAAARGGLMSGNMGQALAQYGQDYASNEYQNAYNRFTNNQATRFNRLASIAGVGQAANSAVGAAGQNYANSVGGLMTGAANAGAAATIGSANAWSGALSGIGNNVTNGVMMNRYAPSPAPSPGGYGGGSAAVPTADSFSYSGALGSFGGP